MLLSVSKIKEWSSTLGGRVFFIIFLSLSPVTLFRIYLEIEWYKFNCLQAQEQALKTTEKTALKLRQFLKSTSDMLNLTGNILLQSPLSFEGVRLMNTILGTKEKYVDLAIIDSSRTSIIPGNGIITSCYCDWSLQNTKNQGPWLSSSQCNDKDILLLMQPLSSKKGTVAILALRNRNIKNLLTLSPEWPLHLINNENEIFRKSTNLLKGIKNSALAKSQSFILQPSPEVLLFVQPLEEAGSSWYVYASCLEKDLYKDIRECSKKRILFSFFNTLLFLIIAFFLSYYIVSKPFNRLVLLIEQLRNHKNANFKEILGERGEVGILAQAFNTVTHSLAERQRSLEQSQQWFANIVELAGEAIIAYDMHMSIRFFNPAAEKLFSCTKEQVLGLPFNILIDAAQRYTFNRIMADFTASADSMIVIEDAFYCKKMKGNTFPVSTTISKFWWNNSSIYIVIVRDITQQKNNQAVQEKYNTALERSNADLQIFAYSASHDLQEPLRMITMYLELLKSRYHQKLDKDANDFIEYAVDGALRMQKIIQELLKYARVSRNVETVLIDPNKILDQLLFDLKHLIDETQAEITYHNLPRVYAVETELNVVFMNFLTNALKFRNPLKPKITIDAEEKEDTCIFRIQDNGIGFDTTVTSRMFGLFQRFHAPEKYEGTGIGLATVKKIIEQRGGKVWAESTVGQGSTFYFSLPHVKKI